MEIRCVGNTIETIRFFLQIIWSLRKALRRLIWHDRIHVKAMYEIAIKILGANSVENILQSNT